jgi:hypothetical protein
MSPQLTFPVFLLPSFRAPLKRRSTDSSEASRTSYDGSIPSLSSSPASSIASTPIGSPPFATYFSKPVGLAVPNSLDKAAAKQLSRTSPDTLRCGSCSVDIAFGAQIVSKGFTGRHGRAYLVSPGSTSPKNLINVNIGRSENRQLVTGAHVVADITCAVCGSKLGWKYVDAKEQSQKYKVGKFILETARVVSFHSWEDILVPEMDSLDMGCIALPRSPLISGSDGGADEEVEFDSEDEDECDDLFMGTWDAEAVAKRRGRRVDRKRK